MNEKMNLMQTLDFMEHHTGTLNELIISARIYDGVNPVEAESCMDYYDRLWKMAGIEE